MEWAEKKAAEHDLRGLRTLEVGAFDVNGSVRPIFETDGAVQYLGVDQAPGPGVDKLEDVESLSFGDGEFELVVSTETLEHVARPWLAVGELARVVAPGGFVLVSARGYDGFGCWRVHNYPFDFWRFSDKSMELLFTDAGLEVVSLDADPGGPGWLVVARKPLRNVYARAAS